MTTVTTDLSITARPDRPRRRATERGPDRLSVALFGLAAFLVVLTLLATGLRGGPRPRTARIVLLRRIYRTTVIETRIGPGRGSAPSVSQSVSSSGASASVPAPVTRSS